MAKRLEADRDGRCCGALGGAAMALPALEIMLDAARHAYAQAAPSRSATSSASAAQSLGGDGDPLHNDYVPNTVGRQLRSQVGAGAARRR